MDISEVRVKLVNSSQERLQAFCSITLDNDFVIRDLKIIDGANGIFVAMPSRKLSDRCPQCGHKNHLRARFCNDCGKKLNENRAKNLAKRSKLHADIAHPINAACRERIQNRVIEAFQEELEKSKQPGYEPVDLDDDFDAFDDEVGAETTSREASEEATSTYETGGYDELVAELKRDAAHRRGDRSSAARQTTHEEPDQEARSDSSESVAPVSSQSGGTSQDDQSSDEFGAGLL